MPTTVEQRAAAMVVAPAGVPWTRKEPPTHRLTETAEGEFVFYSVAADRQYVVTRSDCTCEAKAFRPREECKHSEWLREWLAAGRDYGWAKREVAAA